MPNKYNAKKTVVDGITFDSKREAEVYSQLKADGVKFDRQVEFILQEGFTDGQNRKQRPIKYIADFVIMDWNNKIEKVIDVKGMVLPEFKLKQKLFAHKYFPLTIEIWK